MPVSVPCARCEKQVEVSAEICSPAAAEKQQKEKPVLCDECTAVALSLTEKAHCENCQRAVPRSEIRRDVPGGHGIAYRLWHTCGFRLDGCNEHAADHILYADIPWTDDR